MKNINNRNQSRATRFFAWLMVLTVALMPLSALAQGTRVIAPKNRYSVRDDVQAGQQAAREVEQQLPILNDREVANYVESIGQRLVRAIPGEFSHPEFRYSFRVVNARDINAFALPGGPMYLNRGMIEAAKTEGEMAGVMAHEISHVALRHGTAQATKAGSAKAQLPALGGAILGSILGGTVGGAVAQAGQIGSAAYITRYSRDYETQADILGAQIMSRAGYDPRDLANMFRTIEQQGGGRGGPEFLSSHPNPANRYARISQEAQLLGAVRNPIGNTREFSAVQARLRGQGRAPSMGEIAQGQGGNNGGQNYPTSGRREQVAYPSTRYRTVNNQLFRLSVPDNWRDYAAQNSVTLAPEGAVDQSGVTHGVILGIDQAQSRDLQQATDQYLNGVLQGNPYLRAQGGYRRANISGRAGLATTLAGRSPVTGETEVVTVITTMLRDGSIFYMNAVTPQSDQRNYQRAFDQILRSIQLND